MQSQTKVILKEDVRAPEDERPSPSIIRAILGDLHFWIPALALGIGVALLVYLH